MGVPKGVIAQNWFDTGWRNEQWLNNWEIPFGDWVQESIDWLNVKAQFAFDAIRWPFENLLELVTYDILLNIPWPFMLLVFVLIGFLVRDIKIGLSAAAGIFVCGVLGADYWVFTMQTIGIISVAVIICVAIGLPYGVLCARSDRVWNFTRPILDGMQLVHPFTYLIAIVFFFGIGPVGGTISTMIFAVPPMIRLTNLGIRQVPHDVVEAAQSYGASDLRVLLDVQLPLARPAIMTGVNQVLLLSLSFVGIIAVIAGGGLGQEIFRGIQSSNSSVGAASGLALYLVGVVLDRLSQPQPSDNRTLLRKMGAALRGDYELPPPAVLPNAKPRQPKAPEPTVLPEVTKAAQASSAGQANKGNRVGWLVQMLGMAGGALAIVSVFFTWTTGSGLVSGYARPGDLKIDGSFNGYDASGGSWFGICVVGVGATLVVVSAMKLLGSKAPLLQWLNNAVGVIFAGAAIAGMMVVYLLIAPHDLAGPTTHGVGVYLALVSGGLLLVGGLAVYLVWHNMGGTSNQDAVEGSQPDAVFGDVVPRLPFSPLQAGLAVAAVGLLVVSSLANWVTDSRPGALTPQQQLQIEAERANPTDAGTALLTQSLARDEPLRFAGFNDSGPNLSMGMLLAAIAAAVVVIGVFRIPRAALAFEALLGGIGTAVLLSICAWAISFLRVATDGLQTGAAGLPSLAGGTLAVVVAVSRMRQRSLEAQEIVLTATRG